MARTKDDWYYDLATNEFMPIVIKPTQQTILLQMRSRRVQDQSRQHWLAISYSEIDDMILRLQRVRKSHVDKVLPRS